LSAGLNATPIRQPHIHQYHIRCALTSLGNGFRCGTGFSDHQEVGNGSKQSRQANTNYLMVVHQEQSYTRFGYQVAVRSHALTST
jgi:hypothetical protein